MCSPRSWANSPSRFSRSISTRRLLSSRIAFSRFCSWERSVWAVTTIPVAVAPAQVHAHEHLGPVRGVDAAQADRNRHDRVRAVVRAVQAQFELELVDLFGELVLFALRLLQDRLVIFERGQLDQLQRV